MEVTSVISSAQRSTIDNRHKIITVSSLEDDKSRPKITKINFQTVKVIQKSGAHSPTLSNDLCKKDSALKSPRLPADLVEQAQKKGNVRRTLTTSNQPARKVAASLTRPIFSHTSPKNSIEGNEKISTENNNVGVGGFKNFVFESSANE